jgi:acyl transferase domain-containing protein
VHGEAHGEGTALGGPTEAGTLAAMHGRATRLTLGAAKATLGHS